ncbi:imm11 family protein [Vibrio neptunius]|uniref:imm11 family protein n=1 Tax=Vibrio neptunius TaxID=170651 RepID=UPI003CE4B64D
MNNYEDIYYIAKTVAFQENFLELQATKNTGVRNHTYKKLDFGDGPVFFENGFKGLVPFNLTDGQFDGLYPVVSLKVASVIRYHNIDGFQLFPAVIIGDDGKWHKDFYFFNFYSPLDCVDFENSDVREYKPNARYNEVISYKLRSDVLDGIPEENRLMIKLARVQGGALIFHQKIVDALARFDVEAFQFFKLSEYELDMEYRIG